MQEFCGTHTIEYVDAKALLPLVTKMLRQCLTGRNAQA
jgi:hypothetical protein